MKLAATTQCETPTSMTRIELANHRDHVAAHSKVAALPSHRRSRYPPKIPTPLPSCCAREPLPYARYRDRLLHQSRAWTLIRATATLPHASETLASSSPLLLLHRDLTVLPPRVASCRLELPNHHWHLVPRARSSAQLTSPPTSLSCLATMPPPLSHASPCHWFLFFFFFFFTESILILIYKGKGNGLF
jgi:hypothetical protein